MGDRYKNFEYSMFFKKCALHSFYIQFLNPPFFETPCIFSRIVQMLNLTPNCLASQKLAHNMKRVKEELAK
jgi:hypothetical protein